MKILPLVLVSLHAAVPVAASPQISVEVSASPLTSGATVDFGRMLGGGSSGVVQVEGGMPGTAVFPGLPPGDYELLRSVDGFSNFSPLPGGPFQPDADCEIRYDDPELVFSFQFFYRADAVGIVRELTLKNPGSTDLTISGISTDAGDPEVFDFEIGFIPLPLILPAGGSETLELSFRAFGIGGRAVTLTIENDSDNQPAYTLELSGEGLDQGACDPPVAPAMSEVIIQPANGVQGARFSAVVTGSPGRLVQVEASGDLGFSIPWLVVGEITLDPEGNGSFSAVSDPRTETVAPPRHWYFRLRDE